MAVVSFLLCERDIAVGVVATKSANVMRIPVEER